MKRNINVSIVIILIAVIAALGNLAMGKSIMALTCCAFIGYEIYTIHLHSKIKAKDHRIKDIVDEWRFSSDQQKAEILVHIDRCNKMLAELQASKQRTEDTWAMYEDLLCDFQERRDKHIDDKIRFNDQIKALKDVNTKLRKKLRAATKKSKS